MTPPNHPAGRKNGVGIAGFAVGLTGFLLIFLPVTRIVVWPVVIIGLVLSAVGHTRAVKGRASNTGLAVAGVAISVVGLIICSAQS